MTEETGRGKEEEQEGQQKRISYPRLALRILAM